jgi:hypothetical protein
MFSSDHDSEENSFWHLLFRSAVYMILPIFGILFLHYKNLERDFESKYSEKQTEDLVTRTLGQDVTLKPVLTRGANEQKIPLSVPALAPVQSVSVPVQQPVQMQSVQIPMRTVQVPIYPNMEILSNSAQVQGMVM